MCVLYKVLINNNLTLFVEYKVFVLQLKFWSCPLFCNKKRDCLPDKFRNLTTKINALTSFFMEYDDI